MYDHPIGKTVKRMMEFFATSCQLAFSYTLAPDFGFIIKTFEKFNILSNEVLC
jgi:hypothetical protein